MISEGRDLATREPSLRPPVAGSFAQAGRLKQRLTRGYFEQGTVAKFMGSAQWT